MKSTPRREYHYLKSIRSFSVCVDLRIEHALLFSNSPVVFSTLILNFCRAYSHNFFAFLGHFMAFFFINFCQLS